MLLVEPSAWLCSAESRQWSQLQMCSICKPFPPQKWEIFEAMTSARFFHPTPMSAVEKRHCAYNASVLAHVYEQAVSPIEGAKLLSAPPFLHQKCTSNLWCFHLFPQSPVKTAANGLKWSNHVFSQAGSPATNYTLCSHLICSHFSLKLWNCSGRTRTGWVEGEFISGLLTHRRAPHPLMHAAV